MTQFVVIMSDRRLNREELLQFGLDQEIEGITIDFTGIFYPENTHLRAEQQTLVDSWVSILKSFESPTFVVTDSEFVLNAFRIALKEKRLPPDFFSLYVEMNGEVVQPILDADGRFDYCPKLLNMWRDQLRRLL